MISIRKGAQADLKDILRLVLELAIFEKEPKAVTATLAQYEESYAEGVFDFMVAESDGEIIGLVLYYMTFSTWKGKMLYLEDFVVTQSWRGKGVGALLFDAFMAESKAQNAVLTKWQVYDWNVDAIRFYKKRGAEIDDAWYNCKLFN